MFALAYQLLIIIDRLASSGIMFGSHANSFHTLMAVPLTILQLVWIFPVRGLKGSSYKELRLHVPSGQMIYPLFCIIVQGRHFILYCTELVFCIADVAEKINALIAAIEGVLHIIIFLHLAYYWRSIVRQWARVEKSMSDYGRPNMNMKRIFNILLVIFLALLIVEYPLALESKITCFPYNLNLISKLLHYCALFQRIFIWLFRDMLIIMISLCFIMRLRQIQGRLSFLIRSQIDSPYIWRATREDYVALLSACKTTNRRISWVIIMSYFGNIGHVLVNLFSAVVPSRGDGFSRHVLIFMILFTVVRLALVSFFGGSLNDENEKIVDILISTPSSIFNKEVERFLYHACSKEMILTGRNYFNISRSLILRIANAILTYEVVIMQFVENLRQID